MTVLFTVSAYAADLDDARMVLAEELYAARRDHAACVALGQIAAGGGPQAARAAELRESIGCAGVVSTADRTGRAELIASEAVVGAAMGGALTGLVGGDETGGGLVLLGLGVGAVGGGLAAGALSRDRDVTPGQALALSTAQAVGAAEGALVFALLDEADELYDPVRLECGAALAGAAAGTAAGLVWAGRDPAPGDVAMIRAGSAWGLVIGELAAVRDGVPIVGAGLGGNAGLLVGAGLAALPGAPSRTAVNLAGAGGLVGGLVGVAADPERWPGAAAIGAAGGLALGAVGAAVLPAPRVGDVTVQPTVRDGRVGLAVRGAW